MGTEGARNLREEEGDGGSADPAESGGLGEVGEATTAATRRRSATAVAPGGGGRARCTTFMDGRRMSTGLDVLAVTLSWAKDPVEDTVAA